MFTLTTEVMNITTEARIADNFTLTFDMPGLNITFQNISNSSVGTVGNRALNFIAEGINEGIKEAADTLGKKGIPLQPMLNLLGMKWLDARDTQIFARDGYLKLCSSP